MVVSCYFRAGIIYFTPQFHPTIFKETFSLFCVRCWKILLSALDISEQMPRWFAQWAPLVHLMGPLVRARDPFVRASAPLVRARGPMVRARGPLVRARGPLVHAIDLLVCKWAPFVRARGRWFA
jgi:hypothetical protein